MSEAQAAAPVAAETQTSIPTPAATPPATDPTEPAWLKGRLDRERDAGRKEALRDIGVEDPKNAKDAIAELKKRREADLSEQERLRAENAVLATKASRADVLEQVVAVKAAAEMKALSDEQRAAVSSIAGEDSGAQLKTIEALRPTWAARPAAAAAAPIAAPANTATAAPAPAPSTAPTDNVLATYEALQQRNPIAAAQYRLAHWDAYSKAKNARG